MVSKSHAFFPVILTQFIKYKQFFVQHPSIKNSVHQLFLSFGVAENWMNIFFLVVCCIFQPVNGCCTPCSLVKICVSSVFQILNFILKKEGEIRQKWKKCYSQILVRTSIEKIGYNFCISNLEK